MSIKQMAGALVSGMLFGAGLILSGMTNPANVLQFLDVAGDWSPALAVVMASAIMVAAPAFYWVRRSGATLLKEQVELDNTRPINQSLLVGAGIFGVGWGLSGMCPGPSLLLAAGSYAFAWIFVASMLAGLLVTPWLLKTVRREDG